MKRYSLLFIVFVIFIFSCFNAAAAEEYEDPILFKNIPWETHYDEVLDLLQVDIPAERSWEWTPGGFDHEIFGDDFVYSDSAGISVWIEPSEIENNKVAGYPFSSINLYFVFDRDEKGDPIRDIDHAVLGYANYSIMFGDDNGVTAQELLQKALDDLKNKLSRVYGDIDRVNDSDDQYGFKSAWYGADGTVVALTCEYADWGGDTPEMILIKYSYKGLNNLIGLKDEFVADPDDVEGL